MMLYLSCLFDIHLSGFSNVVECAPHPTPKREKRAWRGGREPAAPRSFLSFAAAGG